eukprot:IDg22362t1
MAIQARQPLHLINGPTCHQNIGLLWKVSGTTSALRILPAKLASLPRVSCTPATAFATSLPVAILKPHNILRF